MAKQSGIGANLYIAGYDLSGDVGAINSMRDSQTLLDQTGIDKGAFERTPGLGDGEISFLSFFNDATGQAHDALKAALDDADRHVMVAQGTDLGDVAWFLTGKQTSYDGARGNDGSLGFTIQVLASAGVGLECGRLLTPGKRTDGSAGSGSSVDHAASSAAGLSAQLQVFSFTGTSVTVKLQESSDDGAGDAWADVTGGGFTAATGRTTQRIETAAITVERYLRVTTTGTFSNAVFAVAVKRG